MTITGAIVLFSVIWFMCLFIALQVRITSQEEDGEVVPGTPASAPVNLNMKKRFFWVTVVTVALWVPLCLLILYGPIGIDEIDLFRRYREGAS